MIGLELILPFLLSPSEPMPGIYCDAVAIELIAYNDETNAFSDKELKEIIGNCEIWEERYEDDLESGEVEPINNRK